VITDVQRMESPGRNRWMIHAVLFRGSDDSAASHLTGVLAERASLFLVDEFIVVASDVDRDHRREESLQCQIVDYSILVNELHREVDILPFRFGVIVTANEIVNTVRLNKPGYRSCLQRIAGFSELNLRWAVPEVHGERQAIPANDGNYTKSKGFEYLKSKLTGKQSGLQLENELSGICADFAHRFPAEQIQWQSSVDKLRVSGACSKTDCYRIARIELLVRKEAIPAMILAASSLLLRSEKPTVASGPWPPYSFLESENVGCVSSPMQRCAITFPNEAVG
jgi:hypothetical protein